MGFLRKKFKQIKKGVKKIGGIFSKALDKLGISKILGKLGPLGSMAIMFAMPYLGAWWSGLGAAAPAQSFIGQAAQTLHKMASTVGDIVLSPAKAMMKGLNAFGPTKDLVTNATNLFKDAHNFVADKLGIKQAFGPKLDPTKLQESFNVTEFTPDELPISQDTKQLFKDIQTTDVNLKNSPLLRKDITLNDIVNPSLKGQPVDNFLINQRSAIGSESVLRNTFYKDPSNLFGVNSKGQIPLDMDIDEYLKVTAPEGGIKNLLSPDASKTFERKLGKLASKNIDWSNVTLDDAKQFYKGMWNLTPNDVTQKFLNADSPLPNFLGNSRVGTIYQGVNLVDGMLRDPEIPYQPGFNPYAAGLAQMEISKINSRPIASMGATTTWSQDTNNFFNKVGSGFGFHPANIDLYDMYSDTYDINSITPQISDATIQGVMEGIN